MLQREEKTTVVLMVTAFLVLVIAYFGFIAGSTDLLEYSDTSGIGDRVMLHGEVVGKRGTYTGDHLILTVDSNSGLIKVFIRSNSGAAMVNESVDVAHRVEIIGTVDEYEGEREIVVEQPGDIRVLDMP